MKALLLSALIGLAAFSARAIPTLDVQFQQWNWFFQVDVHLTDGGTPVIGRLYLNGLQLALESDVSYKSQLDLDQYLVVGENFPTAVVGGVTYDAPSFFVTAPTGPAPVPDSGTSAWLLSVGLVGCAGVHKVIRRSAAFQH